MNMRVNITLLVVLCLVPIALTRSRRLLRLKTDPLSKTRCDLMCFDTHKDNRTQCRSQCRAHEKKPGTCPSSDSPQWAAACVEACNLDSQCDGTQRCCHHGCGSTCSEPLDLLTLSGLPALPIVEEAKEKRRSVIIKWSDGVGDLARAVPGRVMYLLEEQHHLGPKYEEARLAGWNLLLRTNKTKVSIRNLLKPGRWYRFRVAAVSAAGTRGFSSPSSPFTPRRGPRAPPAPKKLRVRPLPSENGTVSIRLEWREPKSDLPVVRYKVFWSRRVRGLSGELDSVLVNHQTVQKDQHYIEIRDLQPNSMYFLQVQTVSQFGVGKLRSEKSAVFYNTTSGNSVPPESLRRREKKILGLKLQGIIGYANKIKARISWDHLPKVNNQPKRYNIHWKTIKCENQQKENKDLWATTEEKVFDIYELDYDCSYRVSVNKSRKSKTSDAEIVVKVPSCEYFKQRANGAEIKCDF